MAAVDSKGNEGKTRVFISYSRKDMAFADRLEAALKARGIEALIDRSEIYAFEDWWKRIQALITKADTIVFVLSPDAVASDICKKEVDFAVSLNKRFAPIVAKPVAGIAVPEQLRRLNFIFFDDEATFEAAADKLVEALSTDIEWIRKHTEIGEIARRWAEAGRPGPKGLLLRSPLLEEAERWIASRPENAPLPTAEAQALIVESRHAATRRRTILSGSLAAGLVVALGLAGLAYWQRGVAIEQRTIAIKQRDEALIAQSRYLAELGKQAASSDDFVTAMLLTLSGLPDRDSGVERPYMGELERQTYEYLTRRLETATIGMRREGVVQITPDGERLVGNFVRVVVADAKTLKQTTMELGSFALRNVESAISGDSVWMVALKGPHAVSLTEIASGKELAVFARPKPYDKYSDVSAVAISPDKSYVAVGYEDGVAIVFDTASRRIVSTLRPGGGIEGVSFSLDNQRVVTIAGVRGALWDVVSGALIAQLMQDDDPTGVRGTGYSPDGQYILTFSSKTARLWDGRNGSLIATMSDPYDRPWYVAPDGRVVSSGWSVAIFSPDSKFVYTGSSNERVSIWEVPTGKMVRVLEGHTGAIISIAVSPDGQTVATGSEDRTARVWDAGTGASKYVLRGGGPVRSIAFSKDGARVFTTSLYDRTLRVWDLASDKEAVVFPSDEPAKFVEAFNASLRMSDRRLVTQLKDGDTRLWDAESGALVAVLSKTDVELSDESYGPGERLVVIPLRDGKASIFEMETGHSLGTIRPAEEGIASAKFTRDGRRIVTMGVPRLDANAGSSLPVSVWDAESQLLIARLPNKARFTPVIGGDSQRIVVLDENRRALLYDLADGKRVAELGGHEVSVRSVALSPNGSRCAIIYEDGMVRLWDTAGGHLLVEHQADVYTYPVVFSRDSSRFLIQDYRGSPLWDAATGQVIATFPKGLGQLAFSPDGRYVIRDDWNDVGYDSNRGVRVWEAASGKAVGFYSGETQSLIHSSDGRRLALWLYQQAWIMDDSWRPIAELVLEHLGGYIPQRQLSPDGERLLLGAIRGPEPKLWDVAADKEVASLTVAHRASDNDRPQSFLTSQRSGKAWRVLIKYMNGSVRIWNAYPSIQALVTRVKEVTPRCLTIDQRKEGALDPEPPDWCIELEKWPYQTIEWKQWLADRRVGKNPPLPSSDSK